ncbi:MAG: ribulose-phosphate 3-epimerase [Desulfonatronovibrionaceae bacterium]
MSQHKQVIISPSLLSSDFTALGRELAHLEEAGLSWVHWDIMDGAFVPNITFGPPVIKACRKNSCLFFDVHLMIQDPDRYLQDFVQAGADLVCVHAEACTHLERTVSQVAKLGAKPAVALNPHTPLNVLEYILPDLYMVLIMSVNPGFGGQKFIPFSLDKIRNLKNMITDRQAEVLIQVDGGVTPENTRELVNAGADVLVSGSAFFGYPPYRERLKTFEGAAGDK